MANTGRRYTEEQIIAILKEAEAAKSAAEVIRRHGVTAHTFYRWKAKFAGMEVADARRLKALEDENRRLKKLVAQQALDNQILKELLGKD
jgi:putative transposase